VCECLWYRELRWQWLLWRRPYTESTRWSSSILHSWNLICRYWWRKATNRRRSETWPTSATRRRLRTDWWAADPRRTSGERRGGMSITRCGGKWITTGKPVSWRAWRTEWSVCVSPPTASRSRSSVSRGWSSTTPAASRAIWSPCLAASTNTRASTTWPSRRIWTRKPQRSWRALSVIWRSPDDWTSCTTSGGHSATSAARKHLQHGSLPRRSPCSPWFQLLWPFCLEYLANSVAACHAKIASQMPCFSTADRAAYAKTRSHMWNKTEIKLKQN